jgi:hypothetical protein
MKSLRFQVMFLVLLLLPAASVFAATDAHKGSLNVSSTVQVADKELPAGSYTVKWDGTGPTAQVNFVRNGKVVATVPAQVVQLDQKANQDVAEIKTAGDGVKTLIKIEFEGKSYALQIGNQAGSGDTASSSSLK